MLRKLTIVAALMSLAAVLASAQTRFTMSNAQVVTVPFSFVAGSRTLPSGTYTLQVDPEKQVILLRGDGQIAQMCLTNREELRQPSVHSELVFQRYGSQYVLKKVHTKASAEGETLMPGTLEKEIARNAKAGELIAVQAGVR